MKQTAYLIFILLFATGCEPVDLVLSLDQGKASLQGPNIAQPIQHIMAGNVLVLDKARGKISTIPVKGTLNLEALRKKGLLKPLNGNDIALSKLEIDGDFDYSDRVLIVLDADSPQLLSAPCEEEIIEVTTDGLVFREETGGASISFPVVNSTNASTICFERIAGVGIICIEDNIDDGLLVGVRELLDLFFRPDSDWPESIDPGFFTPEPRHGGASEGGSSLDCLECIDEGGGASNTQWTQIPCSLDPEEIVVKKVCQTQLQFFRDGNRNPCLSLDLSECPVKVVLRDGEILVYTSEDCDSIPTCGC